METKTKLTVTHNGFHGFTTHSVLGVIEDEVGGKYGETPGYRVTISKSGAEKFRCGVADCKCGEHLSESFWVPKSAVEGKSVTVRGLYPQR